jgi:hypothetical protein
LLARANSKKRRKMMTSKKQSLWIFIFLFAVPPTMAYDNTTTHQYLSELAARASILNSLDKLKELGFLKHGRLG